MEKVRPWCGQPSDRGRLKNRNRIGIGLLTAAGEGLTSKNRRDWQCTRANIWYNFAGWLISIDSRSFSYQQVRESNTMRYHHASLRKHMSSTSHAWRCWTLRDFTPDIRRQFYLQTSLHNRIVYFVKGELFVSAVWLILCCFCVCNMLIIYICHCFSFLLWACLLSFSSHSVHTERPMQC